jgi:hypothetical protein
MEDASRIVESRKDIEGFSGFNNSPLDDSIDFYWSFTNDEGGGYVQSDEKGMVVDLIQLNYYHDINHIIEKYGEPDAIFPISSEMIDCYTVYFLYFDIGIRLSNGGCIKNNTLQITYRTGISTIALSTPEWLVENLQKFGNYQDSLFEWKGYGDYTLDK